MRILVTGGAGFIGSHIVRELLTQKHEVVSLDFLTYAAPLTNLAGLPVKNICHDLRESLTAAVLHEVGGVDVVIHTAAESHVARSLADPGRTMRVNVMGTLNLLEAARAWKPRRFIYTSTDEVFGPRQEPAREGEAPRPANPYAATKTGAEHLVNAYRRSFGVPGIVTRTVNIFGERQHPEKFVPLVIGKILRGETVDIYASATGEVGSRRWCHVSEQARALAWLVEGGEPGRVYHVTAGEPLTNLEMAGRIAFLCGRELRHKIIAADRPGHDLHYAIEASPEAVNWRATESLDALLERTVRWYVEHPDYL